MKLLFNGNLASTTYYLRPSIMHDKSLDSYRYLSRLIDLTPHPVHYQSAGSAQR